MQPGHVGDAPIATELLTEYSIAGTMVFAQVAGEVSTMSTLMENGQNAKVLLGILAQVNRRMMTMRTSLHARPEARTANRTCDVLDYHDPMDPEDIFWDFEAYVEVETSTGELFCWSLELRAKAATWEVYRRISLAQENGGETVADFPHISFESFELFALGVLPLVDEFAESAKDFDFSSRRLGNKGRSLADPEDVSGPNSAKAGQQLLG